MPTETKQKNVFLDPYERGTLAGALIMFRDKVCSDDNPANARNALQAIVRINRLIEKFDLEEIVEFIEDTCEELMTDEDF